MVFRGKKIIEKNQQAIKNMKSIKKEKDDIDDVEIEDKTPKTPARKTPNRKQSLGATKQVVKGNEMPGTPSNKNNALASKKQATPAAKKAVATPVKKENTVIDDMEIEEKTPKTPARKTPNGKQSLGSTKRVVKGSEMPGTPSNKNNALASKKQATPAAKKAVATPGKKKNTVIDEMEIEDKRPKTPARKTPNGKQYLGATKRVLKGSEMSGTPSIKNNAFAGKKQATPAGKGAAATPGKKDTMFGKKPATTNKGRNSMHDFKGMEKKTPAKKVPNKKVEDEDDESDSADDCVDFKLNYMEDNDDDNDSLDDEDDDMEEDTDEEEEEEQKPLKRTLQTNKDDKQGAAKSKSAQLFKKRKIDIEDDDDESEDDEGDMDLNVKDMEDTDDDDSLDEDMDEDDEEEEERKPPKRTLKTNMNAKQAAAESESTQLFKKEIDSSDEENDDDGEQSRRTSKLDLNYCREDFRRMLVLSGVLPSKTNEPSEDANMLYLGYLPLEVSEEGLKTLCPDIVSVNFPERKEHAQYKHAYLEFESEAKAVENYKFLQEQMIGGQQMNVDFLGAKSRSGMAKRMKFEKKDVKELYIGNLPVDLREWELKTLSPDIVSVRFPKNPKFEEIGAKCAFVTFESQAKAEENHKFLQQQKVAGRTIFVDFTGAKRQKKAPKTDEHPNEEEAQRRHKKYSKMLFINNLPPKVVEEEELKALSADIISVIFPYRNRKCAFLGFKSEAKAKENLEVLKKQKLRDQPIAVDFFRAERQKIKASGPGDTGTNCELNKKIDKDDKKLVKRLANSLCSETIDQAPKMGESITGEEFLKGDKLENSTGNCVKVKEEMELLQKDEKMLHIGGLPKDIQEEELKTLSSDIQNVILSHKRGKTFAYLGFESEAKAEENHKLLQEQKIRGQTVRVDFTGEKRRRLDEVKYVKELFIGKLPLDVEEKELKALSPDIMSVHIANERVTHRSAILEFESEAKAVENHQLLQQQRVRDQPIDVDFRGTKSRCQVLKKLKYGSRYNLKNNNQQQSAVKRPAEDTNKDMPKPKRMVYDD